MAARRSLRNLAPILTGLGSIVALVLLFELLVATAIINPYIVPRPSQVLLAFERIVLKENVIQRFLITGGEALSAGLMVSILGVLAGVFLYRFMLIRQAIETWIAALSAAPLVLLYPLFLVIFGRSSMTIVAIATLSGLPPVVLMTLSGLSAIRPSLINVGRGLRLNGRQMFFRILLPAALPSILAGIRLGLVFSMINVVGVEFLINFGGLGPLINELAERYDLPATYAAICFVVLISVCFFIVVERVEKWLAPSA